MLSCKQYHFSDEEKSSGGRGFWGKVSVCVPVLVGEFVCMCVCACLGQGTRGLLHISKREHI